MLENLKKRLAALERRVVEVAPPWPPKEGSFCLRLVDTLGRPCERRGFMEMYQQRAADFWKDWK